MSCNRDSSNKVMRDIDAFHRKYGLHPPSQPQLLDVATQEFRSSFMQEELNEYREAVADNDMAKACDALIDLMYVTLGTMWMHGFPLDECWNEVQRCNMAKVRAKSAGESKRGSSLDVVKPPGWTPPDLESILKRHMQSTGETSSPQPGAAVAAS